MMNRRKGHNNSLQLSGSFLFSNGRPLPQQQQSQYRATQMWHKSVETFLAGVPLSQHRSKTRFWRQFDSSFTGAEAITWFHLRLKENFDSEISREQTRKLLGKFYKAGVFKNVDIQPSPDSVLDENDFKDSQLHIYRLTHGRPGSSTETSLETKTPSPTEKKSKTPESKMKKNYSVEIIPLSQEEKEKVWFDLAMKWLNPLTSIPLSALLPTPNIFLNLGCPTSNPALFPSWIRPAMKYLAFYPDEGPHHVDYPNFEHDVWLLVQDYFKSRAIRAVGSGLLLPHADLFLNALTHIQPSPGLPLSKYEAKFPFPKSEFEEIERIFTPPTAGTARRRFIMGKNRRRIFENSSLSSLSEVISVAPMGLVDTSRYSNPTLSTVTAPTSIYFATSFDMRSPVTRVLSQSQMYAFENPGLELSPADLINHPKYGRLRKRLGRKSRSVGDFGDLVGESWGSDEEEDDDEGGFAAVAAGIESVPETKRPTIEALSLLLLTLDPEQRGHLEVLLRFMSKVEKNLKLCLDVAVSNKDMVFDCFARFILDGWSEPRERDLISFMLANVESIFTGEYLEGFKKAAEEEVSQKQIRKVPAAASRLNKENNPSYCSKISMSEYEDQRLLGETSKSLRNLLDGILTLKDEKLRKKQLRKFEKEYPHIYSEKFFNSTLENSTSSLFQQQQKSGKKRGPFGILI